MGRGVDGRSRGELRGKARLRRSVKIRGSLTISTSNTATQRLRQWLDEGRILLDALRTALDETADMGTRDDPPRPSALAAARPEPKRSPQPE